MPDPKHHFPYVERLQNCIRFPGEERMGKQYPTDGLRQRGAESLCEFPEPQVISKEGRGATTVLRVPRADTCPLSPAVPVL